MKNLLTAALVLAGLLVLSGCVPLLDPDKNEPANNIQNGDLPDKTFWAYNFVNKRYYQVTATNLAVGDNRRDGGRGRRSFW